nr:uncharacterized protein LOC129382601 isoform X1 [Dermacentor andersoni]
MFGIPLDSFVAGLACPIMSQSLVGSSSGQGSREEGGLDKLKSERHPLLLPIVESPDRTLGKLKSTTHSKSTPISDSAYRRGVRFEQQRVDDYGRRKKRGRNITVFPCLSPGSPSGSGSALTSSSSTQRASRNVSDVPHFPSSRRGRGLWKLRPAVVIASAILLSVVLVGSLLASTLLAAGWRRTVAAACRTKPCLEYARLLADSVNRSADPCLDFTRFVCTGWRRRSELSVHDKWMLSGMNHLSKLLRSVDVPRKHQNALQKGAAFLRSCEAVRNVDVDELPKVKAALLEAGIVWPLLPKDSDTVDVLRTWLYTSLTLHWCSILHVSVQLDANTTVIFLEPLQEFVRIAERHKEWANDAEEAERYFETLRSTLMPWLFSTKTAC